MFRILTPEGILLFSFHHGTGEIQVDNWFEKGLKYHCYLHKPGKLSEQLKDAGFSDIKSHIRKAYDFEFETERVYIFANKK